MSVSTTFRKEKSLNGHGLSVLKSALQKYIRRGNVDMATWSIGELVTFSLGENEKDVRRIMTNVRHRLQVILLEDVGDLGLVPYVARLIKKFTHQSLVAAVSVMAMSSKARIGSHAKAIATLPTSAAHELSWVKAQRPEIYKVVQDFIASDCDEVEWRSKLLASIGTMASLMWAWKIYEGGKSRYVLKKRKPVWQIFDAIRQSRKFPLASSLALENLYGDIKNLKESFLCWMLPLVYMVHDHPIVFNDLDHLRRQAVPQLPLVNFSGLTNPSNSRELDPFVYDMHTNTSGVSTDGKYLRFAVEGAVVSPINRALLVPEWEEVYVQRKRMQDDLRKRSIKKRRQIPSSSPPPPHPKQRRLAPLRKETELYELITRIQLNTSRSKSDVYFAKERSTDHIVVVKGPLCNTASVPFARAVNSWKRKAGLPSIDWIKQVYMVPDRWINIPLGVRGAVSRHENAAFLVSQSAISLDAKSILDSTTMKESKLWPPTQVIDWSSEAMAPFAWNISRFNQVSKRIQCDYVWGILAKYITGVNDMADRNFVLTSAGRLLSVDEETQCTPVQPISATVRGKIRIDTIVRWLKMDNHNEETRNWLKSLSFPVQANIPGGGDRLYSLLSISSLWKLFTTTE